MVCPKPKLITVWECGYGHQHKTPEAAQACIDRQSPRGKGKYTDRNREAVWMRVSGQTYRAISDHFGLSSPSHFRNIYERELRRLRHPRWVKHFSDYEIKVVQGKIEDKTILKALFLRVWRQRDAEGNGGS